MSFMSWSWLFPALDLAYPLLAPHSLILASGALARLELVEIPSADGQAALVVVHALAEVANVGLAWSGLGLLAEVGLLVLGGKVGG